LFAEPARSGLHQTWQGQAKILPDAFPRSCGPLPLGQERVYSFAMIQLPASYEEYLVGKDPRFVDTVRPVLLQSAADKLHGVRVLFIPRGHQAHLDDTIPYGTIVEDID
jgi:hypothetical protein